LDIASEELSHMEMVAATENLLNGHEVNAAAQRRQHRSFRPYRPSAGAANASGYYWTGAYVNETGDLAADILSDIAAEQRAKVVYQYLYRQINDSGVKETIDFF
jgi:Mn-containing catalase